MDKVEFREQPKHCRQVGPPSHCAAEKPGLPQCHKRSLFTWAAWFTCHRMKLMVGQHLNRSGHPVAIIEERSDLDDVKYIFIRETVVTQAIDVIFSNDIG